MLFPSGCIQGLRAGWVERVGGEVSGVGRRPYDLDETVGACGCFGDGGCFGLAEGGGHGVVESGLEGRAGCEAVEGVGLMAGRTGRS